MSERDYSTKIDDDYKKCYRSHYRLYTFLKRYAKWVSKEGVALDLTWLNLKSIPSEICLLTKLRELYLHANELKTLPIELNRLTNLTRLDIDRNKLEFIPQGLASLPKLQLLYVDKVQVPLVPSCLLHLMKEITPTISICQHSYT